jgi:hypothetical protein
MGAARARLKWLAVVLPVLVVAGLVVVVGAAPAGAADVSDETTLRAAFDSDAQIDLLNDITLSDCGAGALARSASAPVAVDGHGFTITQTCPDNIIDGTGGANDTTLRNITLTGGRDNDDGGAIDMNGGDLTVVNSTFVDNCAADSAGAIENEDNDTLIIASTLTGNLAEDQAGAVRSKRGDTTIVNSTITGNTQFRLGAVDSGQADAVDASLTLIYDTIVDNENVDGTEDCDVGQGALEADDGDVGTDDGDVGPAQSNPANVNAVDLFSSFGTVIALPSGGPNCDFPATTSQGYNFSDDASCSFTNTTAGDRENAGDPGVGALASNGGPTQTRLPTATSALLNFIPIPSCSGGDTLAGFAVTTDQRGILRPQATGCEVGSVEVVFELVVTFTG